MQPSRPEQATAASLLVLGGFQAALAAGAPWGRAAYGGTTSGVLPARLRAVSGVASLGYGAASALVLRGTGSPSARQRGFTTLTVFMGVGVIANAASRSPVERAVWTPVTAATAVLAWRSRGGRVG